MLLLILTFIGAVFFGEGDALKELRDLPSTLKVSTALIADLRLTGAELNLDDFDESMLKQDVGFITSPVFTDDDDDLDDDYSQETEIAMLKNLEQETCCLYDCLFNSYR
jgi:hypothetical protein